MVKLSAITLVILLLAGCVAPPVSERVSETVRHEQYLPLITTGKVIQPNSKRGLSLPCGSYEQQAADVARLGVAWAWNWSPNPPLFPNVESVPNIWSQSDIGKPLGGNSQWLLGFNEPDGSDQSNMTPEAAAKYWHTVEEMYPGRKLTSPQVLHPSNWLERFYTAYQQLYGRPPRFDAIAAHIYYDNTATDFIARTKYYVELAKRWGVPEVWITEWALSHGLDRTLRATTDEMRIYLDYLNSEPLITRYAPWTNRVNCMAGFPYFHFDGAFDTPLFNIDGSISVLGVAYRDH